MLDVELFGMRPGGHHLANVLLHGLSSGLLFLVLASATGAVGRSLAVAALFAVHPLNVEPVAWIAERKELLSTLFGLSAVGAYVRYARSPSAGRYGLVLGAFALSLLAKSMWVTIPFLFLLLDFWPLGRLRLAPAGDSGAAGSHVPVRALLVEKAPLLALSAVAAGLTLAAQTGGAATEAISVGPGARVANAVVSYAAYAGKAVWPAGLSAFYPHTRGQVPGAELLAAAAFLVVVTALALRLLRSAPWLATGWFWFVGTLVPVIGLVQVGAQGMADRYAYLPAIGLFIVAAWGGHRLAGRVGSGVPLGIGAVLVAGALALVTWRQIDLWSDDFTLFLHAAEVTPGNGIAHLRLSQALAARDAYAEALLHGREAVRLEPENPRAHKNLGYVLYRLGLVDDAIAELQAAIALAPDYAEAHGNLAIAYGRKGMTPQAMDEMRNEMRLRSGTPR
jgi:hypothetical protein